SRRARKLKIEGRGPALAKPSRRAREAARKWPSKQSVKRQSFEAALQARALPGKARFSSPRQRRPLRREEEPLPRLSMNCFCLQEPVRKPPQELQQKLHREKLHRLRLHRLRLHRQ